MHIEIVARSLSSEQNESVPRPVRIVPDLAGLQIEDEGGFATVVLPAATLPTYASKMRRTWETVQAIRDRMAGATAGEVLLVSDADAAAAQAAYEAAGG